MITLKSHIFTGTVNKQRHATTILNSEFVDIFRLTTNKFGLKHNGMVTTKLILNSTPDEWFQQRSQEQEHQTCVHIAAQGDDFRGDRSH
jgi:hypothetical protein